MLPSINISFKELGSTAFKRGERGVVALILREPLFKFYELNSLKDLPKELTDYNKQQVELAFKGYITPPRKIIIQTVLDTDPIDYTPALDELERKKFDYLAIPEVEEEDTDLFVSWVKQQREDGNKIKAVLPNTKADHEGIINFTNTTIKLANGDLLETKDYCSRIAGLIAGTPLNISCTFAPTNEVVEIEHIKKEDYNKRIEAGELLLYDDREKIKVARGVNSFVTTVEGKQDSFKKIKIIEAMDMIFTDIKKTAEDSYLGKFSNSYNNKILLLTAIKTYLQGLERDGIVEEGSTNLEIDIEAQREYLSSIGYVAKGGKKVEDMDDTEVAKATTRDKVFFKAEIKILDAIEEIHLPITI